MKDLICGIIVEYNPLHNGHVYHLERALSLGRRVVAVMSGNFVQRGEPAIYDKFKRTRAALLSGVDMVLELPCGFATASAELFAYGAVKTLACTNIVDYLCFGAEAESIEPLYALAKLLSDEPPEYIAPLRAALSEGLSYPRARHLALKAARPDIADIVNEPNNILGIEYLKAIVKNNLDITPVAIQRTGRGHNEGDIKEGYASAKAIRRHIWAKEPTSRLKAFMPRGSFDITAAAVHENAICHIDLLSPILHFILKLQKNKGVSKIYSEREGIGNRLYEAARHNSGISGILAAAKTKRYTHTYLSRLIIHTLLNLERSPQEPMYIRVLGIRKEARPLLGLLSKNAALPVITNPKQAQAALSQDLFATELYNIALKQNNIPELDEFRQGLIIL